MSRRRLQADRPAAGPAHPGLLLHPATPGSGIEPGAGDGAPPRFADGPADVLLRRLELTVRRRLDGLLQGDHLGLVPGRARRTATRGPTTRGTTSGGWTGR